MDVPCLPSGRGDSGPPRGGGSFPASSSCARERWYPRAGVLRRFGGQGCSEVQVPALGEVAALFRSAPTPADAPRMYHQSALLSSREKHPPRHPEAAYVFCLTPEKCERGVWAAPGLVEPPQCQTLGIPRRHRPPHPQLQRRRLDRRNQSEGRAVRGTWGGGAGGSAEPSGQRPGLGRAPLPRRGEGCGVSFPPGHGGAGGVHGALLSCPPSFPSDQNSLKAAEITGEGRRTSAGAGLLKTVPPHRL